MAFTFENSAQGLTNLNKHLEDKSYIQGYTPSQADVAVYEQITASPDATKLVNAARWWSHVASWTSDERKAWPAAGAAPAAAASKPASDDFDLFGEEDDAEREAEIERRAKEQAAKKAASGKKQEVMKSAVILDVKTWDDSTDLKDLEDKVRAIAIEGLEWKASKILEVAYGIKKLQISCHVVDDKVSVDDIQEQIQSFEDLVQSTDVVAFTKL
jgi:elongation factor 1-beta